MIVNILSGHVLVILYYYHFTRQREVVKSTVVRQCLAVLRVGKAQSCGVDNRGDFRYALLDEVQIGIH
jgi:hypothetical protein